MFEAPATCHNCIKDSGDTIDLKKDDYVQRIYDGKLVLYHLVCYEAESSASSR